MMKLTLLSPQDLLKQGRLDHTKETLQMKDQAAVIRKLEQDLSDMRRKTAILEADKVIAPLASGDSSRGALLRWTPFVAHCPPPSATW